MGRPAGLGKRRVGTFFVKEWYIGIGNSVRLVARGSLPLLKNILYRDAYIAYHF